MTSTVTSDALCGISTFRLTSHQWVVNVLSALHLLHPVYAFVLHRIRSGRCFISTKKVYDM